MLQTIAQLSWIQHEAQRRYNMFSALRQLLSGLKVFGKKVRKKCAVHVLAKWCQVPGYETECRQPPSSSCKSLSDLERLDDLNQSSFHLFPPVLIRASCQCVKLPCKQHLDVELTACQTAADGTASNITELQETQQERSSQRDATHNAAPTNTVVSLRVQLTWL